MCECGCGETVPYKIIDLGESVLVVEIYKGCRYCDTGVMVTLHKMTHEEARKWDWIPDTKFDNNSGLYQLNFPIIGPDDLVSAAKQMGYHESDQIIDDLMENGLDLLQRSVSIRLALTEFGG